MKSKIDNDLLSVMVSKLADAEAEMFIRQEIGEPDKMAKAKCTKIRNEIEKVFA